MSKSCNLCEAVFFKYFYVIRWSSPVKAIKKVGNKITLSDSVFDLPIAHGMQKFTIHEQRRCNDSYHRFLGICLLPFFNTDWQWYLIGVWFDLITINLILHFTKLNTNWTLLCQYRRRIKRSSNRGDTFI